ncbi:MAG TPA: Ig-like domain-containing protein, partial [Bacillota bacterium]|nr:Ig-like domain-containing protein [Bacillota bacterium]
MKKHLWILGFAILLITIVQISFAQKVEKTNSIDRLQAALKTMDPKNEVVQLRAINRRTFKMKDGKQVTFIATDPLNYLEDDNQLQPIDVNVISDSKAKTAKAVNRNGKAKYRHRALRNSVKAQFPDDSDGGVQLEYKKYSVEFVLGHQHKRTAVIEKNKVRYKKVFDNGDLVYTVLPGTIKDEIIFYSIPKTPVISYKLQMSKKLTPKNAPGGAINLIDANGQAIYQLMPAVMYEQNDKSKSKAVTTKFHWYQNQLYCDIVLDMSWLKSKKRLYPVVVDPIVSPSPDSVGKSKNRTLIHCPEDFGKMKCTMDLDGPGWHGWLADYDDSKVYFKDTTSGQVFLHYNEVHDYHPDPCEINISANHDYEVYLFGGKAKHLTDGTYTGHAWATIEYGGENGYLFSELPYDNCADQFTGINNNIIFKNIYLKYPQTIKYKYTLESTNGNISMPLIPYFRITPGPTIQPPGSTPIQGEIRLNPGYYQFELSPSNREHYRVELEFPYGTNAYEKKIVLRTNPGSIESTFMLPDSRDVYLQYHTIRNDDPSSEAYPNVKLVSQAGSYLYNKNFPLDTYNVYDGGDKVYLEKEKLYTMTISRGRSGGSGWGCLNVDFFYPLNKSSRVDEVQLVDMNGNPTDGRFAGHDYQLRFQYDDEEQHTLKSYKLYVNDESFQFNNVNPGNGWITIPYRMKDFKLNSGTTFHCQIEAYDGFDFFTSELKNYTVDGTAPVIASFTGESVCQDGVNSINLTCQARDDLSTIQTGELRWKINDKPGGTRTWTAQTEKFTNLPSDAKVEVTFSVTDQVNNTAALTKTFYTQPEKSALMAPVAIYTSQPGKYHPTLKFTKTGASEYRIQRFLKRNAQKDLLEYDTGFMDASSLSTVTLLPPGLNIVSPINGSSFGRPAYITLTAFTDTDSEVYKVDFYADGKLIDTDTCSPFRILWSNVPPGNYTLTAVATDTDGITQTSQSVTIEVTNIPPTVRIVTPVSGTAFAQPGKIYIQAEATDSDSDISKVEFYNGLNLLGTDTSLPYSLIWDAVPYGNFTLTAKATDSDGASTVSDPVNVIVTNAKPTITLTSPLTEQTFTRPASITMTATAGDSDGTVSRVEFYANNTLLGSANSNPYSYIWNNAAVGRYALKAKAVDNNGDVTWSNTAYVDVIETPDNLWYGQRTVSDPESWGSGYWGTFTVSDNVNSSDVQWFFSDDISNKKITINGKSVAVQGIYTTYYWVPRDVTVVNYDRNDDNLTFYLNGNAIFSQGFTGNKISNNPIIVNFKGKQWNQITMVDDNSGGSNYELELRYNFKYLIQQALNATGGGTVYMSSRRSTTANAAMVVGSSTSSSSNPVLETLTETATNIGQNSAMAISQEYYAYLDLLPVDPHQTYVYRITARNGDKTAEQDSQSVVVNNNPPEITGVEPSREGKSYSNGALSIRVTGVQDYDNDGLTYAFKLTGPVNRNSTDPYSREFTVVDLPDGTYTWKVTVSDNWGGTDQATGTVVVDKTIPTALFSIDQSSLFAVTRAVQLTVSNTSDTVDRIRVSNDQLKWVEFAGTNQIINWELADGDGDKTVYLQAHKPAGDVWGPVVERRITLDTFGPEVTTLHTCNEGGDGKVTFNWIGGLDVTSGLSGKVNIERWENGAWVTYRTDYQENKIEIPAGGYNTAVKIRLQLIDNAGNRSEWSVPAEGYTKAAPGSFNQAETVSGYSTNLGHYLRLKLNPANGAVKYKLVCVQNPGGGDTAAWVTNNLTYQDLAVLPHQTYQYQILTYNSNNEITDGAVAEFTIANNPPLKPVGMGPKGLLNHQDGLEFQFDQMVEMLDPDGDKLNITYQLSTDGQQYTDLSTNIPTGLTEGVTYWWKATLDDGFGAIQETEPVSFSVDTTIPTITVDNISDAYAREQRVRINVSDSGSGVKSVSINGAETSNLNSEIILTTQGANPITVLAIFTQPEQKDNQLYLAQV